MTQEPPDAVNEPGLRELLAKGWHLVIVCCELPDYRHRQCYGDWVMRVARPDGAEEFYLALSRPPYDERHFSTLNTVVRFADKYGFTMPQIPLRPGARVVNVPPLPWQPD